MESYLVLGCKMLLVSQKTHIYWKRGCVTMQKCSSAMTDTVVYKRFLCKHCIVANIFLRWQL